MQQQEMEKKKEKKRVLTANQESDASQQEEETTAVCLSDRPKSQKRFWGGGPTCVEVKVSPGRLVLTAAGQQHLKGFTLQLCLPTGRWGWSPTGPRPPNASSPTASIHIPLQEPPSQQKPGSNPSEQAPPTEQSGGRVGQSEGRGGQWTQPEAMSPPTL